MARFGKEPESTVVRANIELMHAAISEILSFTDGEADEAEPGGGRGDGGGVAKPMDAMLLAKALEHLTRASRHDAELITKIKEQARKEAESKMEAALDTAAKEAEKLSPKEMLDRVRAVYRGEA